MNRKDLHRKIFNIASLGAVASIPVSERACTWFMLLLAVNWFVEGGLGKKLRSAFKEPLVIFCSLFYLLEIAGLFYTHHFQQGFFHAQTETSFLVIPLLFFSYGKIGERQVRDLFSVYCIFVFLALAYCFSIAIHQYEITHDVSYFFFYKLVSPVRQHPVYFSVYTFICIVYLFEQIKRSDHPAETLLLSALLTFFSVALFFLRSKMAVGVIFLYSLYQVFRILIYPGRSGRWILLYPLAVIFLIAGAVKTLNPFSRQLILLSKTNLSVLHDSKFNPNDRFNDISIRLTLAKFGLQVLDETHRWIFGVSPGDAQFDINRKIIRSGMYTGAAGTDNHGFLNYNLHNQYLQTFLNSGITGVILLIGILFFIYNSSIRNRDPILFFVTFIFTIFFLSESALERQMGVLPFFFFTSVLILRGKYSGEKEQVNANKVPAKPLRIFVDAHCFDGEYQGSRTFIKGIYTALSECREAEIFLGAYDITRLHTDFPGIPVRNLLRYRFKNPIVRLGWEIPHILKKYSFDYAHFQYLAPLIKSCRYIVTTHDLLFLENKEYFPLSYRILRSYLFKRSCRNADIRTTPSLFSKSEIHQYYHIDENMINIIPNGVGGCYFNFPMCKEEAIHVIKGRYGLSNFILYVSRIEPRKNHAQLLQSFLEMQLYKKDISLVFIGEESVRNTDLQKMKEKIPAEALPFFKHLCQISNEELPYFYKAARVVVYPSKAEGFGIPPLEAAAMETPVLCANATAMSEFSFFGRFLFDPMNNEEFQTKLSGILFSKDLSYPAKEIASIIRHKYSWEKSCHLFLDCLRRNIIR